MYGYPHAQVPSNLIFVSVKKRAARYSFIMPVDIR